MEEVPVKIKSVIYQKSKKSLAYRNDSFGFIIDLDNIEKDPVDTIIEVELKK